jgi:uncharacterized RDD family membrane protein YckC
VELTTRFLNVDLDDRMSVVSPEGVVVDYQLAGVGTRFLAILIDLAILAVLMLLSLLIGLVGVTSFAGFGVGIAVSILISFLALFGYPIGCDVWADGRTLGKRAVGSQVRMATGHPVTFAASAIRTLLGFVDVLVSSGVVLLVSVLSTQKNQRLGDLAAGTVVIRQRSSPAPAFSPGYAARVMPTFGPGPGPGMGTGLGTGFPVGLDVSQVSPQDVVIARRFLERRYSLSGETRHRLSQEYASRLSPLVVGAPLSMTSEDFLVLIVSAKDAGL